MPGFVRVEGCLRIMSASVAALHGGGHSNYSTESPIQVYTMPYTKIPFSEYLGPFVTGFASVRGAQGPSLLER